MKNERRTSPSAAATAATLAAAVAAAAATSATLPASATDLCYGQRNNQPWVWASTANWLQHADTSKQVQRLPTAADNVYLWASALDKNVVVVEEGTDAVCNGFSVGYTKKNNPKAQFAISGGTLTTSGLAIVGNNADYNTEGVATISSGSWTANGNVQVGNAQNFTSRIVIGENGAMTAAKEFQVGCLAGWGGVVTNEGTLAAADFFPGQAGTGEVVNKGAFSVTGKFTLGRTAGSTGIFRQLGGSFTKDGTAQPIHLGYAGKGVLEIATPASVSGNLYLYLGRNGGDGELVLSEGGSLSGLENVVVAVPASGVASSTGAITMAGGELLMPGFSNADNASYYPLQVGYLSGGALTGKGSIRGWGRIGKTDRDDPATYVRLHLRGTVTADGGGVERDLDMGDFRSVGASGTDNNPSGLANGWYAVNKGRLLYPHWQNFTTANHVTIGDWVYRGTTDAKGDNTLVNSFQLRLYDASGAQLVDSRFNYAALYAPDRSDIPGAATLPGASGGAGEKTLGVWRIGHFASFRTPGAEPQDPVAFATLSLKIRYDVAPLADVSDWTGLSLGLWRWNGTAWTRIARVAGAPDASSPYIAATNIPRYESSDASDNWNVGWFAVAVTRDKPFVLVVR